MNQIIEKRIKAKTSTQTHKGKQYNITQFYLFFSKTDKTTLNLQENDIVFISKKQSPVEQMENEYLNTKSLELLKKLHSLMMAKCDLTTPLTPDEIQTIQQIEEMI